MTGPVFEVDPNTLHGHASQRRAHAAGFMTGGPPDFPDDPDDPTSSATRDLQNNVDDTRKNLHRRTTAYADATDLSAHSYSDMDQQNSSTLQQVGAGGSKQEAAKGLTDVGIGSIMNALLSPLGAITGAFEQSLSGVAQAAGGFSQGGANVLGQGLSAGINAGAKTTGVSNPVGASGAVGGESKEGTGRPVVETHPVSSLSPQSPAGDSVRSHDYVHTEQQDRNSHTVMPAGGGMPMGLGRGMGGESGSVSKPHTYKIATAGHTPDEADEPDEPELERAVAASLPLRKDV